MGWRGLGYLVPPIPLAELGAVCILWRVCSRLGRCH